MNIFHYIFLPLKLIIFIGIVLVILTFINTFKLMYKHLKYYFVPNHQRYIIRILIMIPIYSILTLLSIMYVKYEMYFSLLRDCYESYVIYSFLALLINYVGDKNIVIHLESHQPIYLLPLKFIFQKIFKDFFLYKTNEKSLQYIRIGVLQYVIVKPMLTVLKIIFHSYNLDGDGILKYKTLYPYAAVVQTISVSLSLYCLTLFLDIMNEEIKPYHPVLKFLSVKVIVALCFWQIFIIKFFNHFIKIPLIEGIDNKDDLINFLNNCLIIIEMFSVSFLHIWAYPYELYRVMMYSSEPLIKYSNHDNILQKSSILKNVMDSLNQKDMIVETIKSLKGTEICNKDPKPTIQLHDEEYDFDFIFGNEIEMGEFQSFENNNIVCNNNLNNDIISLSNSNINNIIIDNTNDNEEFISDEFFISLIKQNNPSNLQDDTSIFINTNYNDNIIKIKR